MSDKTKSRKLEHLEICNNMDVEFRKKTAGFERIELEHNAFPELDKKEIDMSTEFAGKKLNTPLIVAAITGGHPVSADINKTIAKVCQELGIGMGVGSQRAMIENPDLTYTYQIRDVAPDILLFGNLGLVQAREYDLEKIERAMESIGGDALCIHINAAQEAMQPEGDVDFRHGYETIERIAKELKYPIVVKEVGNGISGNVASKIKGAYGIDVGGAGGTSWTGVDSLRRKDSMGKLFWDWGIPTVDSVLEVKENFKGKIIATGGIRNGLDIAKSLAIGADLCGTALPILRAAVGGNRLETQTAKQVTTNGDVQETQIPVISVDTASSDEKVKKVIEGFFEELRVTMFLTGAKDIEALKKIKYAIR